METKMNLISMLLLFFCIIGFDRLYNGMLPKSPENLNEQMKKSNLSEQLQEMPKTMKSQRRVAKIQNDTLDHVQ